MQGIGRRSFEPEVVVEARGPWEGMSDNRSYAHRVRHLIAAEQRVLEQGPPESALLVPLVHCQAGKDDDRYRPPGGLAREEALSRVVRLNLADRQRIEADHPFSVGGDESSRRASRLSVPSVALEPAVEGYISGSKLGKVLLASQRLRLRITHCPSSYSKTLGFE